MALSAPKTAGKAAAKKAAATGAPPAAETRADDALPGKEEIARLQEDVRAFVADPRQARTVLFLERLAASPPQALMLEGGSAEERLSAAHYWSLLLNCSARNGGHAPPCLDCPECVRMLTHLHRDCFFYDGLAASIKIDEVRALRSVLGEPPREARRRIVIFREAQALGEAAANSLLKSLEEPKPDVSFVMLAPQRERLLPTLVSRSFVLTLPWPAAGKAPADRELALWEDALCHFLRTGQGFFEKSGAKGSLDANLAHAIVNMCRRALVSVLAERENAAHAQLAALLSRMPESRMRMLDEALAECQDSLILGVNPTLTVEWLATRLFFLCPKSE